MAWLLTEEDRSCVTLYFADELKIHMKPALETDKYNPNYVNYDGFL